MKIQELKQILNDIVHDTIYVKNELDENSKKNIKVLVNYFKEKSEDIYEDLKILLSSRNNENYFAYDCFIEQILRELSSEIKLNILLLNDKYEDILKNNNIFYSIWESLEKKEQINYFKNKRKYDKIDILIINSSLKENCSFKENLLLKEILTNENISKKIPPFSIEVLYSNNILNHIDLSNFEICSIFTKKSYTNLLLKKCRNFTTFYSLYENNNKIVNLIENNGLIFKNNDNNIIYEFILKNPNFIGKFSTKYLNLFNIVEITNMSQNKTLDNESYSTILQRLYKFNPDKANEYFSEESLKRCTVHSLNIYPFEYLDDKLRTKIFNTYPLFNRFIDTIMIEAINNHFKEEDIVNLLRNSNFIEDMSAYAIELLLNKLSFKSAFNMLQSKKILEKINNLNVSLDEKDKIFMKGYLDSPALINKTDHSMIFDMLMYFNDEEILYYITTPYIANKLSNYEIINLGTSKNIKLDKILESQCLSEQLSKNDIIAYIDKMWEDNLDLTIFNNSKITTLLFNITEEQSEKINFNEVNYLFETIRMKSILSTQVTKCSVITYKSVLASYLIFGLSDTIKLVSNGNNSLTLDEVKKLQNDIVNEKLLHFKEDNASIIQNISKKVKKNLHELDNYTDINSFAKELRRNTYLDNIVYLMLDNNYDSYNEIIEMFYNYLKYFKYNEYQSDKELYEYCNGFVSIFINNKYNQYNDEFYKIILKNFKLKESVLYNKRKELGRDYINKLKLKLFVRALTDPNKENYKYAFKENYPLLEIKEKFINYLDNEEMDFDSVLEHVLTPLMNERFDKENCLTKLGINKPKNFDIYYEYIEDVKNITILNNEIEKMKNYYGYTDILDIMNYICYGTALNLKLKAKEQKKLDNIANLAVDLKGQLYVDKTSLRFIYSDNMDIYNIDEIIEYNNYLNILDEIVTKTNNYVKRHIDTEKVKQRYSHDYLKKINSEEFIFPITNKYYELKKRVFSLKDMENIFNGFEISSFKKMSQNLKEFLLKNKNLIMVADGYYEGIVNNFGLIITNFDNIEKKALELDIAQDSIDLLKAENILRLINFDLDIIGKNIDKDIIKSLCDDSYYIELDLTKRINVMTELFKKSFKVINSTIPFIKLRDDNYKIEIVDNYNQEIFKSFKDSLYKIGAIGNDFLHYIVLNKNGFKVVIKDDEEILARIFGIRNGNTIYLNQVEGSIDEHYESLLHKFSDELIKITKDDMEPIEFVIIVNNEIFNSQNGLRIDGTICPVIDNPINTLYSDFDEFKNLKNLNSISDDGFYTNYGDNVATLLASSLIVDKNNFKYYDPDAKYLRNRNNVIKLSNNLEETYITKINAIIALCKEENVSEENNFDIKLSSIDTIYLGDDFVLFLTNNDEIIKYVLPYDKRALKEIELIMKSLTKKEIM